MTDPFEGAIEISAIVYVGEEKITASMMICRDECPAASEADEWVASVAQTFSVCLGRSLAKTLLARLNLERN